MTWFTNLQIPVQAALIAAVVTILGVFLRDAALKLWHERRRARQNELQVFKKYADPLASAATSLLWRAHEIFYQAGRSSYLKEQKTEFEEYKKASTLYRLASMLAWVRAFRRELLFFDIQKRQRLDSLKQALRSFEPALADGTHVELRRLEALADLWGLQLPTDPERRNALGVALNNLLKPELRTADVAVATQLNDDQQLSLCLRCSAMLSDQLGVDLLPDAVVLETRVRAIQRIGVKEAWLYRDWQAAIGDLLIRPVEYGDRAFEVVGFGEFEEMLRSSDPLTQRWMGRLGTLVDELDISGADRFDARCEQLRDTMVATAQMIVALAAVQKRQRVLLQNTLELAQKILADANRAS